MIRDRLISVGVAGTLVAGGLAVLWAVTGSVVATSRSVAPKAVALTGQHAPAPYHADSLALLVVGRDLFRAERRPLGVAYDPTHAPGGGAAQVTAPRPTLVLTGLVWGPTPVAVVEGLPGVNGPRVLRRGDAVAGLRVIRITPNAIAIAGVDTTWTLTVRNPWP